MPATLPLLALAILFAARDNPAAAPASPDDPARSAAAFDRFKKLEGTWQGRSTKGWTEKISYRPIANGSCVIETSFDAHPNETMVTMFYLDGPRLMLTHYCVARNQPRLLATSISDDAGEITFTFFDATNLPSRDTGHMDKVVFKFDGPDRFSSRWTWYQNGKEDWMEEIIHTRVAEHASTQPATRPPAQPAAQTHAPSSSQPSAQPTARPPGHE